MIEQNDKRSDIVANGLDLAIDQYRDQPLFRSWVSSFLKEVQEIEDVIFQLLEQWENPTGVWLTWRASLVDAQRGGRSDADLIEWLKVQVAVNLSNGTPNELINIIGLVWQYYDYQEAQPGIGHVLYVYGSDVVDPWLLVRSAGAAGVPFDLIISEFTVVDATPPLLFGSSVSSAIGTNLTSETEVTTIGYGMLAHAVEV